MKRTAQAFAVGLICASSAAEAEGFLATKPEKLPDLKIGLGDAGFGVSQAAFSMVTGKGYRLKIISTGKKECAFVAPDWFASIWIRKVEVGKVEIKPSSLTEIEMEDEGEAELFFVPIKPGEYSWSCKGLADKGLSGTFSVK